MKLSHLQMDEVAIECEVRNIYGTIVEQMTELKKRLKEEADGTIQVPIKPHQRAFKKPRFETKICAETLAELQRELHEVASDQPENFEEVNQIKSRIEHIQARLNRISHSKVPEIINAVHKLLLSCETLLETINNLKETQADTGSAISQIDAVDVSIQLESDEDNEDGKSQTQDMEVNNRATGNALPGPSSANVEKNSNTISQGSNNQVEGSPNAPNTINELRGLVESLTEQVRRLANPNAEPEISGAELSAPMISDQSSPQILRSHFNRPFTTATLLKREWNVSFDGTSACPRIDRFLYRVERLANNNRIPLDSLVNDLGAVLKGEAYEYYWILLERSGQLTWQQLKEAMTYRFDDRRTDDEIWDVLNSRKQKTKEQFIVFYNQILSASLSLRVPITESQLTVLLRRNMRPGLREKFAGEELPPLPVFVKRCVAIEDTWNRLNFVPEQNINPRNVSEVTDNTEDFSFLRDESENTESSKNVSAFQQHSHNQVKRNNDMQNKGNVPSEVICYTCQQRGHISPNCPNKKKCSCSCSCSSENKKQEMNPGMSHFQSKQSIPKSVNQVDCASNTDPELRRMQN